MILYRRCTEGFFLEFAKGERAARRALIGRFHAIYALPESGRSYAIHARSEFH